MLWLHAVKHYFTEPIGDDSFETLLRQLAEDKLNVKLVPIESVYGDFNDFSVKYGAPPILTRVNEDNWGSLKSQIGTAVEKSQCRNCQDAFQIIQWKSLVHHNDIFKGVWAVSRVLSLEKSHIIALAPPGYAEVVQIAAATKRYKIWEPVVGRYKDLASFKAELCSALDSLLKAEPSEAPALVFYVNSSHLTDASYFDLLFEFISQNELEFEDYLKNNVSNFVERPKSRQSKPTDIIKRSLKTVKRFFHIVVHCESADYYEGLLKRHPTIAQYTDLQVQNSFQDYRGLEALAANCINELPKGKIQAEMSQNFGMLAQVHLRLQDVFSEFKASPMTLDHEVIDQATPDLYFTLRRYLNFVQTTYSLYSIFKASSATHQEKVLYKKSLADKFYEMHSDMTQKLEDLQRFSIQSSTDILSLARRIEQVKAEQLEKEQLIAHKQRDVGILEEELERQINSSESAASARSKMLKDTQITVCQYWTSDGVNEVLQGSENTLLLWDMFSKFVFAKQLARFVTTEELKSRMIEMRTKKLSIDELIILSDIDAKVDVGQLELPLAVALFNWLDAIHQEYKSRKHVTVQTQRIEDLKERIVNNAKSIEYTSKEIIQGEVELAKLLREQADVKQRLDLKKMTVETAEMSNLRVEALFGPFAELHSKINLKAVHMEENKPLLFGDSVILAANIVYLGVLPEHLRIAARKQIKEVLDLNSVYSSASWKTDFHLDPLLRLLKLNGKRLALKIPQSVMSKCGMIEALLGYLHNKEPLVLLDELGELPGFLKKEAMTQSVLTVSAADSRVAKKLDKSLRSKSPLFIKDVAEETLKIDLDPWKIGPGRVESYKPLQFLSRSALSLHNAHKPCCMNRRLSQSENFILTVISQRLEAGLSSSYFNEAIFLNGNDFNFEEAWVEVRQVLLERVKSEAYEEFINAKASLARIQSELKTNQRQFEQELLDSVNSEKSLDIFSELLQQLLQLKDLTVQFHEIAVGYHQALNEDTEINRRAQTLTWIFYSIKQVGRLTHDVSVSWGTFIAVLKMLLAKTLRDMAMNAQEKSQEEEVEIDEDYFSSSLIPTVWNVFSSGLPQQYVGLLAFVLAINLSRRARDFDDQDQLQITRAFLKAPGHMTWMWAFDNFALPLGNWKLEFDELAQHVRSLSQDYSFLLEKLEKRLSANNYENSTVNLAFKHLMEKSKRVKKIPLPVRLMIALHHPDETCKRLMRQFIFEVLNKEFEYSEELTRLHTFIKVASWSLPIAFYAMPGINVVNIVCSLANYYGVGLEVIRNDPETGETAEASDPVDLTCRCAEEGSWVLVSTTTFPSFWRRLCDNLDVLRSRDAIKHTFRIFFDMQSYSHHDIPDSFIQARSVRFYMSDANAEDLEGFGDVWANLLQEDLLRSGFDLSV